MKYGRFTLGHVEAIFNKLGGEAVVERILSGDLIVTVTEADKTAAKKLLDFVSAVTVPATSRFVAAHHFRVDTSNGAPVKIGWLGRNFIERFLTKVEEASGEQKLSYYRLRHATRDIPIIAELGGDEAKVETTLSKIWELLKLQGQGQSGLLLTNGVPNIFYVRGAEGMLWAVGVNWNAGYGVWYVSSNSLDDPNDWIGGGQVFSCDSL